MTRQYHSDQEMRERCRDYLIAEGWDDEALFVTEAFAKLDSLKHEVEIGKGMLGEAMAEIGRLKKEIGELEAENAELGERIDEQHH